MVATDRNLTMCIGSMLVEEQTPSLNKMLRMNQREKKKLSDRYVQWIMLLRTNGRLSRATTWRRVLITRSYTSQRYKLDQDNLAGGAKLLVDALVRQGLIIDDRPKYADLHYQQKHSDACWTEIALYEPTDSCESHKPASMAATYRRHRKTASDDHR